MKEFRRTDKAAFKTHSSSLMAHSRVMPPSTVGSKKLPWIRTTDQYLSKAIHNAV